MLAQLTDLQRATHDIVTRLAAMGYKEAAEAVVGVPAPPELPPMKPPPPPERPPPPPPQEPPEEEEEEEEPEEPPAAPERERYLLAGTAMFIGFTADLEILYARLVQEWQDAAIGSKRMDDPRGGVDSQGRRIQVPADPIPPYAPDAVIRGGALDPGIRIPREALVNRDAFVKWATDKGLGGGASIEIDGLLSAPGKPIVAAVERKGLWIAPDLQPKTGED